MVDLSVYALVNPTRAGGHDVAKLAGMLAAGGASLIQLRDKHGSTRRLVNEARSILAMLNGAVPLLINDRVDVALAAGAQGVHIGQDDMAAKDARRLLGPQAIIGLTIKNVAQAEAAPLDLLDYCAIGGVFATTSKDNPDPPVGLDGLARIAAVLRARKSDLPICAIAGIDAGNAASVIGAGADGVAVISALSEAADPQAETARLRAIVDGARARRADAAAFGRILP